METMGKMLVALGAILAVLGLLAMVVGRFIPFGGLPGDIHIELRNASCYLPLMSGILLSILATILLNLLIWLLRK